MGKRKRSGSWSKGCEESKKSDDCDSQEELDGDSCIASKANIINGVRCSARVQEKQEKLRREASPSKQVVLSETVCSNNGTPGSNINVSCKGKSFTTENTEVCLPTTIEVPGTCGGVGSSTSDGQEGKRKKRTWELWSQYDKQLFFEALNEFGKDFDAIQNHLAAKLKSKNKTVEPTQIKKKEQVRHFYYRTWNKIQKYLHFPKDMKKVFQELYGLVNYGELRKKQRALNGKTAAKLSELVEKGSTTIKVKGKTQRVKTPVCQALKKINNLTDVEHTKVPVKVLVELLPKDGDTWKSVQSLSHNPRVKTLVLLQRTLASIIFFLEERWKSNSDKIKEQMMATFGKKGIKRLRLVPSCARASNIPIYKAYDTASSAKISLNAYSSNVLNKVKKEGYPKSDDIEKRKRKKSGSTIGIPPLVEASDSVAEADCSDIETSHHEKDTKSFKKEKMKDEALEDTDTETSANQLERMLQQSLRTKRTIINSYDSQDEESDNCTMQNNLEDLHQSHITPHNVVTTPPSLLQSKCLCNPSEDKTTEPEDIFSTAIDDEVIKRGWTADEAASLTIGEVYLLVGSNEKISFEYEWDYEEEDTEIKLRTRVMLDRLIAVARNLKKKKQVRHKILGGQTTLGLPICPNCGLNTNIPNTSIHPNVPPPSHTIPTLPINPELPSTSTSITVQPTSTCRSYPVPLPPPPSSLPLSLTISNTNSNNTITNYQTTTVLDVADSSISSTTPSLIPLSSTSGQQQQQQTFMVGSTHPVNLAVNENETCIPSSMVKVKKITPTLVSSSCTGAMLLTSVNNNNNKSPLNTPTVSIEISPTDVTFIPPPSITQITVEQQQQQQQQQTFRKPTTGINRLNGNTPSYTPIRPAPPCPTTGDNNNSIIDESGRNIKNPPKPFTIVLPKGNRRLGRPCCKKNIVPRYLPLLPKSSETQSNQQPQQQQQTPVWEIVGNKPAPVHTLYMNNSAQLIPVTSLPMTATPSSRTLGSSEKEDPSSSTNNNNNIIVTDGKDGKHNNNNNLTQIKSSHTITSTTTQSTPNLSSNNVKNSNNNNNNNNNSDPPNKILPNPDDNSVASSNFQDLLKVSRLEIESEKTESNLSLSSFMDISLPESTRNVATECLKSEKFLDVTLGSSNCSLSLSNFLNSNDSNNGLSNLDSQENTNIKEDQSKTKKSNDIFRNQSPPSNLLSHDSHQWLGTDGSDLSLGSLLNNLDPVNPTTSTENEMNFQSIIDDSNNQLDFTSKFSEFVAELDNSRQ